MKEGRQENFVKRVIEKEIRKSRKEGFRGDSRKEEGKREIEKKEVGREKRKECKSEYEVGVNARVNRK